MRPASANKPSVQKIQDQGIKTWFIDLNESNDLISALSGVDVLISAIGPQDVLQQKKLFQAAKLAGIKRVVPCAFITVAPPNGAMSLRDEVRTAKTNRRDSGLTDQPNRKKKFTTTSNSLAFLILL